MKSNNKTSKTSLEVAPTTLLLIYSFQFRFACHQTVPLSRLVSCNTHA